MYNSILYYLPDDVHKLYKHVRWRVQRRWRIQQSTIMCTLVTTYNLRFLRGYVYNSSLYYHQPDVYKLYNRRMHVWWRVHRMWREPQSTTLCTLVASDYLKYVRGCVYTSLIYHLPADVYKLYKHVSWRVHWRRRVQQATMVCTLVTAENL